MVAAQHPSVTFTICPLPPPFRRNGGATWVSLHSILLSYFILYEQFLKAKPNVEVHVKMVFLELFVERFHSRTLIVQLLLIPFYTLTPSVFALLHPYLQQRLEEHCSLVCRRQVELHEEGVVGVVCLKKLAHGFVFEELAVGYLFLQHVLQSGGKLEGFGKLVVEGYVTAHGEAEHTVAVLWHTVVLGVKASPT